MFEINLFLIFSKVYYDFSSLLNEFFLISLQKQRNQELNKQIECKYKYFTQKFLLNLLFYCYFQNQSQLIFPIFNKQFSILHQLPYQCHYVFQEYSLPFNKDMLQVAAIFVILVLFVAYKYYFKPKAEKNRYAKLLKSLGYTVYQNPFSFFGVSMIDQFQKGEKLHKDSMYNERTIYPHVDVVLGNILDKVQIILVNPDLLKEFYGGVTPYKYPKYQLILKGMKSIIGQGIVTSEGEIWKNKRKLLSKVFNFDLIIKSIPKIVDICNQCYDDFDKNYEISEGKFKYKVLNISAIMFNNVMMKCFFGYGRIKDKINGVNYEQFVVNTIAKSGQLSVSPFFVFFGKLAWSFGISKKIRQTKQAVSIIRQKSMEILKQRTQKIMNQPKKLRCDDIIQALIQEKMDNKQNFSYTDQELIDQFQTFLVAGTDTTSLFFTMIVFYLGKYPQIHRKVREEVKSIIESDADITYENLKKLIYIDWVQCQTTRFYGPLNGVIQRCAAEDNYIKDIPIVKGTIVSTQPRGNHYNQKYFKNPNEFRPQRWEKECNGIHPYAFIGFSAGIRSCIGKQLAYLQSKIALVKLIMRYETFEVPEEVTLRNRLLFEPQPFDVIFTKSTPNE